MTINCFLTVSKNGSVRVTKGATNLNWDEVSIAVELTLPDALFRKPQLSASIIVPNEAAVSKAIDATVADNFKEAVRNVVGTDVKINIQVEPS